MPKDTAHHPSPTPRWAPSMDDVQGPAPGLRHLTSINDLSNAEIDVVFDVAEAFLDNLSDPHNSQRIARNAPKSADFILATLFYEASTRTRLSFESAALRLGGRVITSADPNTSSAAKGESIADTVRVVENYADVIVLRHPRDGAAKLAAEYANVPVINGGDGSHEHPTQTLCDVFTLKRQHGRLKGLNVAISGDLKGSRTIHSFVYALARYGASIISMPAPGMGLPKHVGARLQEEFGCVPYERDQHGDQDIDVLYVAPDHEYEDLIERVDVMYITRFQKERWTGRAREYPRISQRFLEKPRFTNTRILHPLPRIRELDTAIDSDRRASYFQQAAFGVPVRMALIAGLLGLPHYAGMEKFPRGIQESPLRLYHKRSRMGSLRCVNRNCIVHDITERRHTQDKFYIVPTGQNSSSKLRCYYCETDLTTFVVGDRREKVYSRDSSRLLTMENADEKHIVVFTNQDEAESAGFAPETYDD